MGGWLSGSVTAARTATDRAELWLPGALVSFAAVGWLVLLLTVAPTPDAAGAAGLGMRLLANPLWPWNAVALGVALVSGLATILLAVAFGEVALLMGLSDPSVDDPPLTVPRAVAVLTLAALPVVVAAVVLGWIAAPTVFDTAAGADPSGGGSLGLLGVFWPYLLVLATVVVIAQAIGAAGLRWRGRAVAEVRRRGHRLIPQAAVTLSAFIAAQLVTAGVLGLLWQPLSGRLSDGGLSQPTTVILLLGFVWIWLVLVIICGVVQAWISAWWNAELGTGSGG